MSQQLELLTESPSQWPPVLLIAPDIQKKEIKPFVLLALKELEGNPDSRTSSLQNVNKFAAIRAIVRHVARLRSAAKGSWNMEDVNRFLEGLRFTKECTEELSPLLCTDNIYDNVPKHLRVKPGLVSLQWKIDISLSQTNAEAESSQEKCKEIMYRDTQIILMLTLTDGQTKIYRLSVNKFHELRFVIASALKSIIVLEKRNCMRRD